MQHKIDFYLSTEFTPILIFIIHYLIIMACSGVWSYLSFKKSGSWKALINDFPYIFILSCCWPIYAFAFLCKPLIFVVDKLCGITR